MATEAERKARLIRLIHVGRRDLHMEEDTYRRILIDLTGKESAKDCRAYQLERVIDHMKRAGFKVRTPKKSAAGTTRQLAHGGWYSKVRAVWLQLHTWGGIDSPSETALAAYVKRQSGVDDMRWARLPEGHDIMILEGIKKWAARVGMDVLRRRWIALSDAGLVSPGDVALRDFVGTCHRTRKSLDNLPFDAVYAALDAIVKNPDWKAVCDRAEAQRDAA